MAGEINAGALTADIAPILEKGYGAGSDPNFNILVHTIKDDITAFAVESIEKVRDFSNNVSDFIIATFTVYGEDFKKIFNNRDNLEVSIEYNDAKGELISSRYKLLLLNHDRDTDTDPISRHDFESQSMYKIEGQCILLQYEGLRTAMVEAVYKTANAEDIIRNAFTEAMKDIKVGGIPQELQIDITKPDNDTKFGHVIVPTGTGVLDFPSYLQNTTYGVYNGNIGTYVTLVKNKPTLFVYPLYNEELYDKVTEKIMIFLPDNARYNYAENSYLIDGELIKILATSDAKTYDTGDNDLSSAGDTLVSSNPYTVMDRNASVTDDKVNFAASNQVAGAKIKDKRDGVDKQIYVGNDSNLYAARADMIKANQAMYSLKWNNSNIDLLKPGMPVCLFMYDKKKGLLELKGTLQSAYEMYSNRNKSATSIINISVTKPLDDKSNAIYNEEE